VPVGASTVAALAITLDYYYCAAPRTRFRGAGAVIHIAVAPSTIGKHFSNHGSSCLFNARLQSYIVLFTLAMTNRLQVIDGQSCGILHHRERKQTRTAVFTELVIFTDIQTMVGSIFHRMCSKSIYKESMTTCAISIF
jgi:hypothetical protein